jgi:hypothetical protein
MSAAKEGSSNYLIPVFLGKVQTRGSPLNTGAIDENVNLTAHYVESILKEVFDGGKIIEVAVDKVCRGAESTDGMQGL